MMAEHWAHRGIGAVRNPFATAEELRYTMDSWQQYPPHRAVRWFSCRLLLAQQQPTGSRPDWYPRVGQDGWVDIQTAILHALDSTSPRPTRPWTLDSTLANDHAIHLLRTAGAASYFSYSRIQLIADMRELRLHGSLWTAAATASRQFLAILTPHLRHLRCAFDVYDAISGDLPAFPTRHNCWRTLAADVRNF
jgi:hypothetical protein